MDPSSQRPLAIQVCCVCNKRFLTKRRLDDHTDLYHGVNWHPAVLARADDQMEFKAKPQKVPGVHNIPWPVTFGE
jgi:hypothetical protein